MTLPSDDQLWEDGLDASGNGRILILACGDNPA